MPLQITTKSPTPLLAPEQLMHIAIFHKIKAVKSVSLRNVHNVALSTQISIIGFCLHV